MIKEQTKRLTGRGEFIHVDKTTVKATDYINIFGDWSPAQKKVYNVSASNKPRNSFLFESPMILAMKTSRDITCSQWKKQGNTRDSFNKRPLRMSVGMRLFVKMKEFSFAKKWQ